MKSKKKLIIFLALLVGVILWSLTGILNLQKESEPYKISVIVDNSYHDSWQVLQKGLGQAATDNNVVMKYVYTNKFESTEQQMSVVEREIENGADGIIVQWQSSEVDYDTLSKIVKDKAIVMLDSDIDSEGQLSICGVDNEKYGIEAVNQIVEYCAENKITKVGIVMGNDKLVSTQEQLKAIKDRLKKEGIEPMWILHNTGQFLEHYLSKALDNEKADVILSVGSIETETCADYLYKNDINDIALFGAGYSTENVYYLDKHTIKSMLIPDQFNMGYQAIEMIVEQLEYHYKDIEYKYVDFHTVKCNEIYDGDNEKIVFPIVQ